MEGTGTDLIRKSAINKPVESGIKPPAAKTIQKKQTVISTTGISSNDTGDISEKSTEKKLLSIAGGSGDYFHIEGNPHVVKRPTDEEMETAFKVFTEQGGTVQKETNGQYKITGTFNNECTNLLLKDSFVVVGFVSPPDASAEELKLTFPDYEENPPILFVKSKTADFYFSRTGELLQVEQLHREIEPEEIGITPVQETLQEDGFVIGGVNPTEKIRQLRMINGRTIDELQAELEDRQYLCPDGSEPLRDIMAADNDYVLAHGLTHQDLGRALRYAYKMWELGLPTYLYKGRGFRVERYGHNEIGRATSPFHDETKSLSHDLKIKNESNGKEIAFSTLLGHMIERYGFYEGKIRVPRFEIDDYLSEAIPNNYRLDPWNLIEVFDYLKEEKVAA